MVIKRRPRKCERADGHVLRGSRVNLEAKVVAALEDVPRLGHGPQALDELCHSRIIVVDGFIHQLAKLRLQVRGSEITNEPLKVNGKTVMVSREYLDGLLLDLNKSS